MNIFPAETAPCEYQSNEVCTNEVHELNEFQLTLVGGGNIIVTCG